MKTDDIDTLEFEFPLVAAPIPQAPAPVIPVPEFGACSDRGKVRPENEDSYVIYRIGRAWERIETNLAIDLPELYREQSFVMAVADGMGGVQGGRIASHLAIRVAVNLVLNSPRWLLRIDNPETRQAELQRARERAEGFFRKIDQTLAEYMAANPQVAGMGTTLTAAMIVGKELFTMHTGDSRAYLFRGSTLYRLTRDQTVAQALADAGGIPQEQVARHWLRHKLASCLGGTSREVDLELGHIELLRGDKVLVCTDGLHDLVPDQKLAEILVSPDTAAETSRKLVQAALDAGGRDNVTALVARYSSRS